MRKLIVFVSAAFQLLLVKKTFERKREKIFVQLKSISFFSPDVALHGPSRPKNSKLGFLNLTQPSSVHKWLAEI